MFTKSHPGARRPSWAPTLTLATTLLIGLEPAAAVARRCPRSCRRQAVTTCPMGDATFCAWRESPSASSMSVWPDLSQCSRGVRPRRPVRRDRRLWKSASRLLLVARRSGRGPAAHRDRRWVAPALIERGPERFVCCPETFKRFGEGTVHATVATAGTDIVPETELHLSEQPDDHDPTPALWEAPDIGNLALETSIPDGQPDRQHLGCPSPPGDLTDRCVPALPVDRPPGGASNAGSPPRSAASLKRPAATPPPPGPAMPTIIRRSRPRPAPAPRSNGTTTMTTGPMHAGPCASRPHRPADRRLADGAMGRGAHCRRGVAGGRGPVSGGVPRPQRRRALGLALRLQRHAGMRPAAPLLTVGAGVRDTPARDRRECR